MTRLAIIETDDSGTFTGIVRDLDRCTPEEWEAFEVQVTQNAERSRMQIQADIRLSLLLQAADAAGLFSGNQINLYNVLEPYVQSMITQHEQKKGLMARFDRWQSEKRSSLIRWLVKLAMKVGQTLSVEIVKSLKK